jgi:hypothetical protein
MTASIATAFAARMALAALLGADSLGYEGKNRY